MRPEPKRTAPGPATEAPERAATVVLAAVDCTDRSTIALLRAAALARVLGAELHAVHVIEPTSRIHAFFRHRKAAARTASAMRREDAAAALLAFCEVALARRVLPSRLHVAEGEVVPSIVAVAAELCAALIVIPGDSPENDRRFRERVDTLVRKADRPVLVARPPRPSRTIVAATDFTSEQFPALTRAAELGARTESRVVFMHNVPPTGPLDSPETAGLAEILMGDPIAEAIARRRADLGVVADLVDAQVDTAVLSRDRAADAILETARRHDADLVVVGSHRRRGMRRLASSNTAVKVATAARRCVLAVPLSPAPEHAG
ncbi:MAG: universal stress protein [Polyangiaceae bacterium]